MATSALTRLRWRLGHALRAIGLPGQVAGVLLIGSLAVVIAFVVPLHNDIVALEAANDASALRLAAARARPVALPPTPAEQLAQFVTRFPAEKDLSSTLTSLVGTARKRSVRLEQAEFRLANDESEPLQRYSILVPVKADYRSLRGFLRDALREQPALALADLSVRRSDPKTSLLEAQLHFVLFVRKPA